MPAAPPFPPPCRAVGRGSTASGPWVLYAGADREIKAVGLQHPDVDGRPSCIGTRGGDSSPLYAACVRFYAPNAGKQAPLLIGWAARELSDLRYESDAGQSHTPLRFRFPDELDFDALIVNVDEPGSGTLVAKDSHGITHRCPVDCDFERLDAEIREARKARSQRR